MKFLESLLLGIPYLFLKKIPYLWVGVVAFYTWPPVLSSILLAIIALGLLMMKGQDWAWERYTRREFAHDPASVYVTHSVAPASLRARNGLLLLAASAVLGVWLNGQFDFNSLQWTLLIAGLMALYKDALLFGPGLTVIVTDLGLSFRYVPGHIDYRILIRFNEIRSVARSNFIDDEELSVLSPVQKPKQGLMIKPRNPAGFSTRLKDIFIVVPNDAEVLKRLPFGLGEK